jgi:AbrB family looped-hinge helix DNA binding protein
MMEAGVVGYLDKSAHADNLLNAIRRAAFGENLFSDEQKTRAQRWRQDIEVKWNSLSKREKEILRLLALGATNKFISKDLQITLPASTRRKANLKEGDLLEAVVERDGSIRLLPKTMVDRALVEQLTEKQQLQDIAWATKQKRKKAGKK